MHERLTAKKEKKESQEDTKTEDYVRNTKLTIITICIVFVYLLFLTTKEILSVNFSQTQIFSTPLLSTYRFPTISR